MVSDQKRQRALTQKRTLGGRFEVVAYSSFSISVSLRMAASLDAPSTPILLRERLRARDGAGMVSDQELPSAGADAKANASGSRHLSEVSAAAEGSNLLSTIAPGTPMPLRSRSSLVTVSYTHLTLPTKRIV